jgi:hypothetical protein
MSQILEAFCTDMEDVFDQARRIVDGDSEDRSNWETFVPPYEHNSVSWKWGFCHHPPAVPRQQQRHSLIMCKCGALCLELKELYQDKYPYWCLHCGPQETITKVDH